MANTVVAAGVLTGVGAGQRASINGDLWVEAGVLTGVAAAGATIGSWGPCIAVDTWDPPTGATVEQSHPQEVEFHTVDSYEATELWGTGADFDLGTYYQTERAGTDGVLLEEIDPSISFDDYDLAALTAAGQPGEWIVRTTTDTFSVVNMGGGDLAVRAYLNDGQTIVQCATCEDYSPGSTGIIKCRIRFNTNSGSGALGVCWNVNASGTSLTGWGISTAVGYTSMTTFYFSQDWAQGQYSLACGTTIALNTWYWVAIKYVLSGGTQTTYGKFWIDGNAEPASWTTIQSGLTTYPNPGAVGLVTRKGSYHYAELRWDNFSYTLSDHAYRASGTWTSELRSFADFGRYSRALVSWVPVTPTGTTVGVDCRWNGVGAWLPCTNGGKLPGIDTGQDMRAGSTMELLQFRASLATSDVTTTPSVTDLLVSHTPFEPTALTLQVDGEVFAVPADGNTWGSWAIVGGAKVRDWANLRAWFYGYWTRPVLASPNVSLWYGQVRIDGITLTLDWDTHSESGVVPDARWTPADAPQETDLTWDGRARWYVVVQRENGDDTEARWSVIDATLGMKIEAWYIIGHYELNDHQASLLAGALSLGDHQGGLMVQGYQLDDHGGGYLVQGYTLDDQPADFLPGVWTLDDRPGAYLVGVRYRDDQPAALLVYGVDRRAHVDVSLVADALWRQLAAAGYDKGTLRYGVGKASAVAAVAADGVVV